VRREGRDARLEEDLGGLELTCVGDRFRLQQVFWNILDNALAACPDPVRVTIRCAEARLESEPAVRVAVRDSGPGLTAEQQQKLFEPFYTTKTKGTGLGMAVARRIVEAHGGEIAVGDAGPPGAEIVLTLPTGVS
jgi:signal transduction histidine kinase